MTQLASRYDAVVVGGGHNGLAAAAYLARAGRSVLVLEALDHVGGAAVSAQVFPGVDARLSRYSYLVSLLPRTVVDELGLQISLRRRRFSSYTPVPGHPDGIGLLVDNGDDERTAASFRAVTGDDRAHAAWRDFYATTHEMAQRLWPTVTEPLRSAADVRALLGADAWRDLVERPVGETVAERFGDDTVAGVVLTDALIGTFADVDDPGLAQNRCFLYHVVGGGTGDWDVPVGGMGSVSGALAQAARSAGATLLTSARVTCVDPGSAGSPAEVTWSDADGTEHRVGADHVLAGCAPATLARLLGDDAGDDVEGAQLKVNMLLSRLPRLREDVDPVAAFSGTFHVNETASQLRTAYQQAAAGQVPDLPPCEIYCHSLSDDTILGADLRAAGAQTLTLFGLHMPSRLFARDNDGVREQALTATLRSLDSVLAEPIEDCLLRAPDGTPCLEARSPLDVQADVGLPGGNIFQRPLQWPWAEDDADVGRWGVETDHPRVLLAGAGARRGGGVSAIAGRSAAMAALGRS
ncbi:NAD(P)/FAD-dependent oxidoreductase [Angustibacter speluncae]